MQQSHQNVSISKFAPAPNLEMLPTYRHKAPFCTASPKYNVRITLTFDTPHWDLYGAHFPYMQ